MENNSNAEVILVIGNNYDGCLLSESKDDTVKLTKVDQLILNYNKSSCILSTGLRNCIVYNKGNFFLTLMVQRHNKVKFGGGYLQSTTRTKKKYFYHIIYSNQGDPIPDSD